MKKSISASGALFWLIAGVAAQEIPKPILPPPAVKVLVVPFANRTGETSLDWLSYGLQDSITTDLTYIRGFDTVPVAYLPKEPSLRTLGTASREDLLKLADNEQFDQIWMGQFRGNAEGMTIELAVVDNTSEKTLRTEQFTAPLKGLLEGASLAVLRMAEAQGLAPAGEARTRVLSRKTLSVEAWKMKTEGLLYLREFLDSAEGPEGQDKENVAEKCEEALDKAIAADPSYAEALDNSGLLYLATRRFDKALAALDKSLQMKPYLVNPLIMRGMISVRVSVPKALEDFRRAADVNPSLSPYHDTLFDILSSLGKKDEALRHASGLLRNSSPSGKLKAIRSLMGVGGQAVVQILTEALTDPNALVRGRVFDGLWYIGNRTVVPHFLAGVQDPDEQVRQIVIQALGSAWTGDPRIGPVLKDALKSPAPRTRQNAAWALGNSGEMSAVPDLIELLKDPVSAVRDSAATSLGRLGDKRAVPALLELLKDTDVWVCGSAAASLRTLGGRPSGPPLYEALKDPDVKARRKAARVLAELAEPSAVPSLFEALNDPDQDVRKYAIGALRKIDDRAIVPRLISALKNPDEIVRINSVVRLRQIGGPDALPALMEAAHDVSPGVRDFAVQALGQIAGKKALPQMLTSLKDPEIRVRLTAIKTLGKTGDPSAVPALIKELEDPLEDVRDEAAWSLGEIKNAGAIPSLMKALEDPGEDVRYDAALALAKMGHAAGLQELTSALGSLTVREGAVEGLLQLGETASIYAYFERTSDVFIFNQLRKHLAFSDRLKALSTSPDPFLKSAGLYMMALRAREAGKFEEELDLARQALLSITPQDRSALAILCLRLKAHAEMKLTRPREALASAKEAEETFLKYAVSVKEKEDYGEPFEESILFLKGEVLAATGESPSAVKAYEEALGRLERSQKDYLLKDSAERLEVMARTSLGALQVKMGKGNLEKAVESGRNFASADSIEMESEEKRYLELARQRLAEGNYEESQRLMEELSLRRSNYINRKTTINLADPENQRAVDEFRRKQEEINSLNRRVEELAQRRAGQEGPSPAEEEMKGLEADRNAKRRELQVYLTQLKKSQPDMAALLGAKPLEITTIQERLPGDTVLLQYLLLPEKLVVFVIKNKGLDIVEIPANKNELLGKVGSLRKAILAKVEGRDSRVIKPLSRELYGALVQPVEARGMLKGARVLGIAPNGFLHQLPFGLLVDQEEKYLVDRFDIFYLNSTSLLGVAMARGNLKISDQTVFLGISNPDGSLEYADVEVSGIAGLFSRKMVYSGKDARRGLLQTRPADDAILHLSTHGVFDPTDSTKSYLVMSDSHLTVEDIWGLPLKGTRLTVLSACETGIGEVLSGDDVVSLENAFIFAGSPAVVATLWSVADESTAELMRVFYENLVKGKTRAEALTDAQRQLRKRYDHPFFWAAFTLRGDWR
jgi:HEAT repeat protein/CHAT domain-containing protein/TolB-like protein